MIKPDGIETIVENLNDVPINWDEFHRSFTNSHLYDRSRGHTIGEYCQHASEMHIHQNLLRLQQELNDYDFIVGLPENKRESASYIFKELEHGAINATLKPNADNILNLSNQEYDQIIVLNGVPVVFEVKIAPWKGKSMNSGSGRKRKNSVGRGLINALRHRVYNRKLSPIRELFEQDVGYAVVVPRNVFHHGDKGHVNGQPSTIRCAFREDNGVLVSFYEEALDFKFETYKNLRRLNLPIKDN